jgi:hypothetical protein
VTIVSGKSNQDILLLKGRMLFYPWEYMPKKHEKSGKRAQKE